MSRIAVIDGIRTPFIKYQSDFRGLSAQELGRIAFRELIERVGFDPGRLDEVIVGCVGQPAEAANVARVVALLAGVPRQVPAFTVHRNCASGIEAAVQAVIKIRQGEGSLYLTGGTESMSNIPLYYSSRMQDVFHELGRAKTLPARLRAFLKLRPGALLSPTIGLMQGLTDPVCGLNMGQTAEVLAKEFGITRREQDEFALQSHLRAAAARDVLREEIVPVIPPPGYAGAVVDDNGPREKQTIEALTKLRPVFDRHSGTVTAGNASQITDGACSLLVGTEEKARELGREPLGYIKAFAFAGVEPHRMGIGPAHAIPLVLRKAGMKMSDIQAFEINEAFAAQVLACLRLLESDAFAREFGYEGFTGTIHPDDLNVNGGAIALGHPVGTTGARLILTMLKHMQRRGLNTGLVSLCIGGGQGAAVILER